MHKYTFALLLLLTTSLTFSCQSPSDTNSSPAANADIQSDPSQSLTFQTKSVTKRAANCQGDTCSRVELQYLQAQGEPAALRDSLNQYVQRYLLSLQLTNNPDADLQPKENAAEFVADVFLQQHAAFMKDFPDAGARAGWYLRVATKPLYQTPGLVTLQIKSEGYSGGAHGYAMTILQTFDSTGHALKLTEMVTDTVLLKKLVEQKFREVRELGQEPWEKQGFYTQAGNLPFPQNAALTQEGLLLYYNAYEVNAYAFGPTELRLPYTQLNRLLKPAFRPTVVRN